MQHQPCAMSLPLSQPVRDTPASQPRSAIARFQVRSDCSGLVRKEQRSFITGSYTTTCPAGLGLANLSRVAARASSRLAGPSGVSPQVSVQFTRIVFNWLNHLPISCKPVSFVQGSGNQMSNGPATTPAAGAISADHVDSATLTDEQLTGKNFA